MFIWWFGVVKCGYVARVVETRNPNTVLGLMIGQKKRFLFKWQLAELLQPQWRLTYDVRQDHFEQRPVSQNTLQPEARPAHVEALLLRCNCHLQHRHDMSNATVTYGANWQRQ